MKSGLILPETMKSGSILLDKNEKIEAKKILLKAIKKGFTRKTLVRLIGLNKVEIFVEKLKPLGNLD